MIKSNDPLPYVRMYVHVHIRMQENPILYVCVCTCVRTYVELTVKS